MKYFIRIASLALLLLSANAFATDTTTAEDLETRAAKGNAIALAKLKTGAESGDAAYETAYGTYFFEKIDELSNTMHCGCDDLIKNYQAQAFIWYQKAAEQGYAPGEAYLGSMYSNGYGVKSDEAKALAWYKKAADQGNAYGEAALGTEYYHNPGDKDAQAAVWLTKAADQGNETAEIYLGDLYSGGRGLDKHPVISYALYDLAGDYQDLSGFDSTLHLSKAEIKRAKALKQRMSKIGVSAAIAEYLKSSLKSKKHTNQSTHIP